MSKGRAIVTGASGFIASHLVRRLLHEGYRVGAVVRYKAIHRNIRLADLWNDIDVIECDIRNRGSVCLMSKWGCDKFFHLAAYNHVGQSFDHPEECMMSNVLGTVNCLDLCDSAVYGPPTFVYVSSSEIYGAQKRVPWSETMCPNPSSPYAVSKLAGEQYCELRQRQGWDVRIVRPFNTYGPGQSEKAVIPSIIKQCLRAKRIQTNPGEQTREFNYVDDVIEGLIRASEVKYDGPINLSCGQDRPIRSVINDINELCGKAAQIAWTSPYRHNEIMQMRGDATQAKKILGWESRVTWEEGIENTVDWFRRKEG